MHVGFHSLQVLAKHVHLVDCKSLLLAGCFTNSKDALKVFSLVQLRNITRVEHIINVLKHLLVDNLGINEQEGSYQTTYTTLHQAELEVISPIGHVVSFDNLNIVQFIVAHESGEFRQRLTSRSTNTEKECVTHRLSKNSADSVDVIARIQEHDKLHRHLCAVVVVIKVLIDLLKKQCQIFDLDVRSILSIDSGNKITIKDSFHVENISLFKLQFLRLNHKKVKKYIFVRLCHSISEHPLILMDPESK